MYVLIYIFLFFCFFPFVQIFPLGTDNQPMALIVGIIIILIHLVTVQRIPKIFFVLSLFPILALFIFTFGEINFIALRSLASYFSVFIIPYSAFISFSYLKVFPISLFKWSIVVYFICGLVQLIFIPDFMTFILARGDSSITLMSGRGVVGLTPEPTFYGFVCLLHLITLWLVRTQLKVSMFRLLNILVLIQIVVFSRSTASIFILLLSLFSWFIYRSLKSKRIILITNTFFIASAFILIIIPLMLPYIQEYRYGKLLSMVYDNPLNFMFSDGSMNIRFNSIYFSILGSFDNLGLPNGFNYFSEYYNNAMLDSSNAMFFPSYLYKSTSGEHRIMSGFGAFIFEMGFISVILFYVLAKMSNLLLLCNKYAFLIISLYFLIALNALTFTNSYLCMLLGLVLYLTNNLFKQSKI